jgi:CDGSH-type Zn-finger protein
MTKPTNKEFEIEFKKDRRYSICTCGLSARMPYCDSAHRSYNEANDTDYKSIKISVEEDVKITLSSASWTLW